MDWYEERREARGGELIELAQVSFESGLDAPHERPFGHDIPKPEPISCWNCTVLAEVASLIRDKPALTIDRAEGHAYF